METNVLNKGAKQLRQRWSRWACQMSKRKLFTSAGTHWIYLLSVVVKNKVKEDVGHLLFKIVSKKVQLSPQKLTQNMSACC